MSITIRLWSKQELESLQHDRWLATVFMNRMTFSAEEMKYYPYNLRKIYQADWSAGDTDWQGDTFTDTVTIYATDDEMVRKFIGIEYNRQPDYLAEVITKYRELQEKVTMGYMKKFLCEKITEFAEKIGVSEETIYDDPTLYDLATRYASLKLLSV